MKTKELEQKIITRVHEKLNLKNAGDLSIDSLCGDASYRRYFRLNLRNEKKTFILMKMKEGFNSKAEEITKSSKNFTELPFINIHGFLKSIGIQVPEIIAHDDTMGFIILEDLGNSTLYDLYKDFSEHEIKSIYEKLILEMIRFQTAGENDNCVAFFRKYDRGMCMWELEHFKEYGIEIFLNCKMSKTESDTLNTFYKSITNEFMNCDFLFCHRDYHSKNVMILDLPERASGEISSRPVAMRGDINKGTAPKANVIDKSFKIIDFQDALLAPNVYDLASLLRDSYISLPEELITQLLNFYIEKFKEHKGKGVKNDDFVKSFDLVSIQRNLKAAGRFVFIEKIKSNSSYIKYIPGTLKNVTNNLQKHGYTDALDLFTNYFEKINTKISNEYGRD